MKYAQELFVQIFWAPMFILMGSFGSYGESSSVFFIMSATFGIILSVATGVALAGITQIDILSVIVISFGIHYAIGIIARLTIASQYGDPFKFD